VANAEEESPPTQTTEAPQPVVTIKVEDVPDNTQGPTTHPDTSVSNSPDTTAGTTAGEPSTSKPPTTVGTICSDEGCQDYEVPNDDGIVTCQALGCNGEPVPTSFPPKVDDNTYTCQAIGCTDPQPAVVPTTNAQNHSDQDTQINGTQVAIVNSGDNVTHNDPTNGSAQTPNSIGTGGATAIGTDDTNLIDQDAQVVLTDQAVANILQAALIINIGAALANSGLNGIMSTPSGGGPSGAINSGDATAIGNSMDSYITQAARADGTADTDDAAAQLAVSLWMGLAMANTGTNSITGNGTGGTGGAIGAGDATAIGNQSLTDIMQGASAVGSGTSQINIEQYATVMNMGFALANSGINDISGVATGLLTAGDTTQQNDLALDLFSMLLPALLSSYATTGGSGSIGTGDALAIGNDSETYVQQLAEATAAGDGIASIIQSVLVANVGGAGANTGGNSLGGRYANLSPEAAKAVVTLAAFLSQMLALVHTSSSNQANALVEQGLDVPFGDIVLTIRGQMQGYDTTLTNASGARANVRQVTIILSLGIAEANSGLNAALGVNQNNATSARVGTNPDAIDTGDGDARNEGLVIICQRRNADDIECLAPPPDPPIEDCCTITTDPPGYVPGSLATTPDPETVVVPSVSPESSPTTTSMSWTAEPVTQPRSNVVATPKGGSLPATGMNASDFMLYAAIILGLGTVMFMVRRRPKMAMALPPLMSRLPVEQDIPAQVFSVDSRPYDEEDDAFDLW
jgi:LPXTG-motif cell wall-anchored protein